MQLEGKVLIAHGMAGTIVWMDQQITGQMETPSYKDANSIKNIADFFHSNNCHLF